MRLSGKIKYILGAPLRRWRDETDTVYVLDMPISLRPVSSELQVVKKETFDEQMKQFSAARQSEDESWHEKDYQSEIRSRIEQGHWCYLALLDQQPVGVIHASKGTYFIDVVRYRLRLPEEVVAIYDVYTAPIARGRGFYTPLWNSAVNDCLEMGFHHIWGFLMPHNLVSIRAHNKLGLNHIFGKVTQRQKWGFRWHRYEELDMKLDKLLTNLPGV